MSNRAANDLIMPPVLSRDLHLPRAKPSPPLTDCLNLGPVCCLFVCHLPISILSITTPHRHRLAHTTAAVLPSTPDHRESTPRPRSRPQRFTNPAPVTITPRAPSLTSQPAHLTTHHSTQTTRTNHELPTLNPRSPPRHLRPPQHLLHLPPNRADHAGRVPPGGRLPSVQVPVVVLGRRVHARPACRLLPARQAVPRDAGCAVPTTAGGGFRRGVWE